MGTGCRKSTVFLSILVLFAPHLILLARASDRITKGQSIRDGETLISSGDNFKLGFFRPDDSSSTNRYVGIWFNKVSIQSVVWVANRGNPIWNSFGVLSIQDDGNLNITDGNGKSVWSTSASIVSSINSTAVLLDNGNFLLCEDEVCNTEKALWQSFEDPGDTFLPGMRVGLNSVNGETRFTSWKSSSDPSKGNFTKVFTMDDDTNGLAQIVLWKNSRRYWRSGVWNGQVFIGIPDMTSSYFNGFNVTEQGGKYYITYSSSDVVRFQTRGDGREEQQMWDAQKNEWNRFWSQPGTVCQMYNTCGAFASCSMSTSPICTCLDGFEPTSMTEWNGDNWSSGCMRSTRLQCERNTSSAGVADGFLKFDGLKLPDHSVGKLRLTDDQCKNYCLENCTCKAYAYVNEIGCMTWDRELVDIQEGGYTLNVRLAKSDIDKFTKSKQGKKLLWIIILCAVLGLVFLIIAAYLLWRWKCKASPIDLRRMGEQEPILLDDANASRGDKLELPMLSFDSIVRATDNFSDANKLGQGGFGTVYKGKLSYGKEVAIKRLSSTSGQGAEEFMNEITLIAKLQHRNLVRLLGCCIQREEKILVYEYLPNKSLDAFIFDSKMRVQLDWEKRFSIIEGIARGLLYLHRDSRLRIIHRDLKASNVLLDEEMNPKISDFGLAKIFGGNQNQENTKRVVGTYGYMAPEYAMEGLFSVKSDVYSFGVLLLEIISGTKNTQYRDPEDVLNLLGYAWKLWNEEKAMEFVDPTIIDSCSESDVLRCIHVGLLCVQDSAKDRPTMSSVVLMLESEATVIPKPQQPNFTIGRPLEMGFSMESSENISKNGVTVTMIVGR